MIPCKNTTTVVDALNDFAAGKRKRITISVITSSTSHQKFEYTMKITERKKIKRNTGNKEPKEKYIGFATNSPNVNVRKYAKRWGIETGYRMIESTRPRTRSTNMASREFCFLYAIIVFNAWVMANALISRGR